MVKLPENPSAAPAPFRVKYGEVITKGMTDYYVIAADYAGNLELVRLKDLQEGYKANVTRHQILTSRPATDEEHQRITKMLDAKYEAQAKFREGAIVRVTKASKAIPDTNALFVITKINPKTIGFAQLGGGLSFSGPMSGLVVVDPAEVLK